MVLQLSIICSTLNQKGKYQFKVCLGTACYIRGGQMIVDVLKEELGIDMGGVTEDMMSSVLKQYDALAHAVLHQ